MRVVLFLGVVAAGCAADPASDVPDGYVRFEPEPITLQPGESGQWVQYVANPFDVDMDIVDIVGAQGSGGHHAVLYATPTVEAVGYTRDYSTLDQLTDRFLGGVGGESGAEVALPEGAVFRVPAGNALYIQTHYFNAGTAPLVGTTWLDVKLEPASDEHIAVGTFTNVTIDFRIPANAQASATTECVLERDVDLVMFANHAHEWADSVRTTTRAPDAAEEEMLKDDPAWTPEWATNANFSYRDVDDPVRLAAGTRLTTTCNWTNTTSDSLAFPDEMCLFVGFDIDGAGDVNCVDGDFTEL